MPPPDGGGGIEPDENGGLGDARPRDATDANAGGPPAAAASSPDDDASNYTPFATVLSKKAKKQARKAAEPAASSTAAPRAWPARAQEGATRRQTLQQAAQRQAAATTSRGGSAKLSPTDKRILGDCVRKDIALDTVLELFAIIQRATRTKAAEDAGTYTRTYDSDIPEQAADLHCQLKLWYSTPGFGPAAFRQRMESVRLIARHYEPATAPKRSWKTVLVGGAGDAATEPVTRWTAGPTPRPLAETRAATLLGKDATAQTLALLRSAIAEQVETTLIARLEGNMRMHPDISHAGILRQVVDVTPSMANTNQAFKTDVSLARYDETSNRVLFTFETMSVARRWINQPIPLQGHMLPLLLPRGRQQIASTASATVAMDEYEFALANPTGALSAHDVWYVVDRLLGLKVVRLAQQTRGPNGVLDPTIWTVVIQSRGCPPSIKDKTRLDHAGQRMWIHHTAFATHPPCGKCAHPSHPTHRCKNKAVNLDMILQVHGEIPTLAAALVTAGRDEPAQFSPWLKRLEARMSVQQRLPATRLKAAEESPIIAAISTIRALAGASPEWLTHHLSHLMPTPTERATAHPLDDLFRLVQVSVATPTDGKELPEAACHVPDPAEVSAMFRRESAPGAPPPEELDDYPTWGNPELNEEILHFWHGKYEQADKNLLTARAARALLIATDSAVMPTYQLDEVVTTAAAIVPPREPSASPRVPRAQAVRADRPGQHRNVRADTPHDDAVDTPLSLPTPPAVTSQLRPTREHAQETTARLRTETQGHHDAQEEFKQGAESDQADESQPPSFALLHAPTALGQSTGEGQVTAARSPAGPQTPFLGDLARFLPASGSDPNPPTAAVPPQEARATRRALALAAHVATVEAQIQAGAADAAAERTALLMLLFTEDGMPRYPGARHATIANGIKQLMEKEEAEERRRAEWYRALAANGHEVQVSFRRGLRPATSELAPPARAPSVEPPTPTLSDPPPVQITTEIAAQPPPTRRAIDLDEAALEQAQALVSIARLENLPDDNFYDFFDTPMVEDMSDRAESDHDDDVTPLSQQPLLRAERRRRPHKPSARYNVGLSSTATGTRLSQITVRFPNGAANHDVVVDLVNRAKESQPPRRRAQRQLQVTTFLTRDPVPSSVLDMAQDAVMSDAEAVRRTTASTMSEDSDGSDVVYLMSVPYVHPAIRSTAGWEALKSELGLIEVVTPGNGSCFFYMLYAMTYGRCDAVLESSGRPLSEAVYNKFHLCKCMTVLFDDLVNVGVIDIEAACRHVTGLTDVSPQAVRKVYDHYMRARTTSCRDLVALKYWATENEIRAAAYWLAVPLLIFERSVDGRVFAQLYYPCPVVYPQYDGQQTVMQTYMSEGAARQLLETMIEREIIPYAGVLSHEPAGDGKTHGHFNALRLTGHFYGAWAGSKRKRDQMQARLIALMQEEGYYPCVLDASATTESVGLTARSTSGSDYTPSQSLSSESVAERPRRLTFPRQLRLPPAQEEDLFAEPAAELVPWAPPQRHDAESVRHDDEPQQQPGDDSVEPMTATPQGSSAPATDASPVSPTVHSLPASPTMEPTPPTNDVRATLVQHCTKSGAGQLRRLPGFDAAVRANRAAFYAWRDGLTPGNERLQRVLANVISVGVACERLAEHPTMLVSLLGALPCVPIVCKYTRSSLIRTVGCEVFIRGRIHQLRQLADAAATPPLARRFCLEWANAIQASSPQLLK